MSVTERQAKNIQGIGIAGFRKDRQQLIFARIDDAGRALRLLHELAQRTANAWEVKHFNDLFSELRHRGREAEHAVRATWVATALSASGLRKLGVKLDEPADIVDRRLVVERDVPSSQLGGQTLH